MIFSDVVCSNLNVIYQELFVILEESLYFIDFDQFCCLDPYVGARISVRANISILGARIQVRAKSSTTRIQGTLKVGKKIAKSMIFFYF